MNRPQAGGYKKSYFDAATYTDAKPWTNTEAAPESGTATLDINAQRPTPINREQAPNAQRSIQSQHSRLGVRR